MTTRGVSAKEMLDAGSESALIACVALVSAAIYSITAAPGAYWDDGGEAVAVALRGGILHPPGHALPSLLFAALGDGRAVVLAGAVATALALAGLVALALRHSAHGGQRRSAWVAAVALGAGSLDSIWRFATTPEVYAFLALALVLLYGALPSGGEPSGRRCRKQLLAGHLGALATATHILALPTALAVSAAHIVVAGRGKRIRAIGRLAIGWTLAATIFLYLPIQGLHAQDHAWGAPHRLSGFIEHLLAADFATELAGDVYRAPPWADLLRDLGPGWALLLLAGIVALLAPGVWRGRAPSLRPVLVVTVAAGIFLALRFGGGMVLDAYLLPVAIPLALAVAAVAPVDRAPAAGRAALTALLVAAVVWSVALRWNERDLSGRNDAHRYGAALAVCAPDSALVLLDNTLDLFALEEYRASTGERGDLVVVYPPVIGRRWAMERALASLGVRVEERRGEPGRASIETLIAAAGSRPVMHAPLERPAFPAPELSPHGLLFRLDGAAGESPSARAALDSFIELASGSPDRHTRRRAALVLARRAEWAAEMGRLEQASSEWDRALELAPNDPRMLHNAGALHRRRGDFEGAERIWSAAAALRGAGSETFVALGRVRQELGKDAAAIESWLASLDRGAEGVEIRLNLGSAYLRRGEPAAAIAHLERAVEIDPASADGWDRLALALRLTGRGEEARAAEDRGEGLR